jgi:hypothetical protein
MRRVRGRDDVYENPTPNLDQERRGGFGLGPMGPTDRQAEAGHDSPAGALVFDRLDRVAYAAPVPTGTRFPIFTVRRDVTKGFITFLGIWSPQFDWFGVNEYHFELDDAMPYDQNLESSGTILVASSYYAYAPIGTIPRPKVVRIAVKPRQVFAIRIRPQTTPAANVVVYNLFIRTGGFFYK